MSDSYLDSLAKELANLAKQLEDAQRRGEGLGTSSAGQEALSNLARLRTLLQGPSGLPKSASPVSEFLQQLATESQVLSCLRWLCEFRVLACIPPGDSVTIKDLSELLGVPEAHLNAVVGLMATVGFLSQPRPCYVAHTTLSACFLSDLSLSDAAQFLGECVVPSALHMAEMSRRHADNQASDMDAAETAFRVALTTPSVTQSAWDRHAKLQRQWFAFLTHGCGVGDLSSSDILARFDWFNLGNARIVEVGAESLKKADALSRLHPALEVEVQFYDDRPATPQAQRSEGNSRVTVQQRRVGTAQSVRDAAAYILRVPSVTRTVPGCIASQRANAPRSTLGLRRLIAAELEAHLDVLRTNSSAMLIVTARVKLGGDGEGCELKPLNQALLRMSDLVLLQLTGEGAMELTDLLNIVEGVTDDAGRLSVARQLASPDAADVALVVKYQRMRLEAMQDKQMHGRA